MLDNINVSYHGHGCKEERDVVKHETVACDNRSETKTSNRSSPAESECTKKGGIQRISPFLY